MSSYFQLLEDSLIVERVEPIATSNSRKKLTKSAKWLFYDLGVRRVSAAEGLSPNIEHQGHLFEHWVGLELIRLIRQKSPRSKLRFWRDPDGPEVDWVLQTDRGFIPIEVKWSENPNERAAQHVKVFSQEYRDECIGHGYVVCRTSNSYKLKENITAIDWQDLMKVMD